MSYAAHRNGLRLKWSVQVDELRRDSTWQRQRFVEEAQISIIRHSKA